MIGSSKQRVWIFFFFFAWVEVSFCRNNYHGSASQQREKVAWSHCIFHFQPSSFRVLAFPSDYSVGGKDNQRPWVKHGLSQSRQRGHQTLGKRNAVLIQGSSQLPTHIHPQDGVMTGLGSHITTKLMQSLSSNRRHVAQGYRSKVRFSNNQ